MYTAWDNFSSFCKRHAFLRRLFVAEYGRVIIAQWPNWPLWSALALSLVSRVTHDPLSSRVGYTEVAIMSYWALLEIGWGASLFRRLLGVAVLFLELAYFSRIF